MKGTAMTFFRKTGSFFLPALLTGLLLCGCMGKLQPKTAAEIKDTVVQNDWFDENVMTSFEQDDMATFGGLMKNGWTLVFYDYGSSAGFDDFISGMLSGIEMTSETQNANYTLREHDKPESYGVYVTVGQTYLSVVGPNDAKEDIRSFLRGIGYFPE